jgi:hypothetical protein
MLREMKGRAGSRTPKDTARSKCTSGSLSKSGNPLKSKKRQDFVPRHKSASSILELVCTVIVANATNNKHVFISAIRLKNVTRWNWPAKHFWGKVCDSFSSFSFFFSFLFFVVFFFFFFACLQSY